MTHTVLWIIYPELVTCNFDQRWTLIPTSFCFPRTV